MKIGVEHGGPIYAVLVAIGRKEKVDVLSLYQLDPESQIKEKVTTLKLIWKIALGSSNR